MSRRLKACCDNRSGPTISENILADGTKKIIVKANQAGDELQIVGGLPGDLISDDTGNCLDLGSDGKLWTPCGGGGAKSFKWTQTTPSTTWTIPHTLNSKPLSVAVYNENGEKIVGYEDWAASTPNRTVLRFTPAVSGTAILTPYIGVS